MTWTRIAQLTAEARVLTNIDNQGTNLVSISSTQAHTATYSYALGVASALWGVAVPVPTAINRVGYWLRHAGFTSSVIIGYLYMAAVSTAQYEGGNIGIKIDTVGGNLLVVRPTSGTANTYETLATVAIPASLSSTNTWAHIGVYHYAHASTGTLNLYINGVLILSYTGDTRMYGQGNGTPVFSTDATHLWIAGGYQGAGTWNVATAYVDDSYFDNSSDENVAAALPQSIFDVQLVTGAGANTAWTASAGSNYQCVDENPNTGDADYIKALVAALKDTYVLGDITVPSDYRIVAMIPTVFVRNVAAGPLVRLHAYDGSLYENSADLTPALDYNVPLFARFIVQPDGSDWNQSAANSMQFGVESRGSFA